MIKRFSLLIVILLVLGLAACQGGKTKGNLMGVVTREGTGDPVPNPVLIIGRVLKSPTVPDFTVHGDTEGRFEVTLLEGNYTVQIGTSISGPFFEWPDPVPVEGGKTTIRAFQIPPDI